MQVVGAFAEGPAGSAAFDAELVRKPREHAGLDALWRREQEFLPYILYVLAHRLAPRPTSA